MTTTNPLSHYKSILIGLTQHSGEDRAGPVLDYGLSLAREAGAHVTLHAGSVALTLATGRMSAFAAGFLDEENRRLKERADAAARAGCAAAAEAGVACAATSPHLGFPDLVRDVVGRLRVHDLAVLGAEGQALGPDRGLVEEAVVASGRPVLVVPPRVARFACRRVLVAWDGSAYAARAVAEAMPLLRASRAVDVVFVAGEREKRDLRVHELVPHLARHGVPSSARIAEAAGRPVDQVLREEAAATRADMIVMGAFVHSRLRELVFGGVTRALLNESPVPLFMTH